MKKNIFITILAILVLGLGGYLVYDKVFDNGVKEEVKDESSKQESKEFDLAEAKKLVDKYTLGFIYWPGIFEETLSEEEKINIAINYTNSTKVEYTCKEAFPNDKDDHGQFIVQVDDFSATCYEMMEGDAYYNKVYSYESVNETYKELFGDKKDAPKRVVSAGFNRYAYSEKYDAYFTLSCECGGAPTQDSYYDVASAIETNDTLEVIVNYIKFVFTEWDKKYSVSQNYNINVSAENVHDVTDEQIKGLYDRAIKELDKDEIQKYKFTFKKNDTGYYLDSIIKLVY